MDPPVLGRFPVSLGSDTSSISAIITALYESISHLPGDLPDWDRMRPLFAEGARIIPPSPEGGAPGVMDVETFVERVNESARDAAGQPRGFHEREIAQGTETFGGIAHVWSTYESRYSVDEPEPFSRGINSFQLVRFDERWWVVTIFWDVERPSQSIPDEYLR